MSARSAWSSMLRGVGFGSDLFISHAHRDGARYARRLWVALRRRRRSAFLDRGGMRAGDDIPDTLRRAIDRSTTLVVVGTPGAWVSSWVGREIEAYVASHGALRIVRIAFPSAPLPEEHPHADILSRRLAVAEPTDTSHPSTGVVSKVNEHTKGLRRRTRRTLVALVVLAALACGAAWILRDSARQREVERWRVAAVSRESEGRVDLAELAYAVAWHASGQTRQDMLEAYERVRQRRFVAPHTTSPLTTSEGEREVVRGVLELRAGPMVVSEEPMHGVARARIGDARLAAIKVSPGAGGDVLAAADHIVVLHGADGSAWTRNGDGPPRRIQVATGRTTQGLTKSHLWTITDDASGAERLAILDLGQPAARFTESLLLPPTTGQRAVFHRMLPSGDLLAVVPSWSGADSASHPPAIARWHPPYATAPTLLTMPELAQAWTFVTGIEPSERGDTCVVLVQAPDPNARRDPTNPIPPARSEARVLRFDFEGLFLDTIAADLRRVIALDGGRHTACYLTLAGELQLRRSIAPPIPVAESITLLREARAFDVAPLKASPPGPAAGLARVYAIGAEGLLHAFDGETALGAVTAPLGADSVCVSRDGAWVAVGGERSIVVYRVASPPTGERVPDIADLERELGIPRDLVLAGPEQGRAVPTTSR